MQGRACLSQRKYTGVLVCMNLHTARPCHRMPEQKPQPHSPQVSAAWIHSNLIIC